MLFLPGKALCGGILPHLSVCDLQALDTAFTNKCLRPQLQQVWKSYQYDDLDTVLTGFDIDWLCGIGVQIIALNEQAVESNFMAINISTLKKLHIKSRCSTTINADILCKLAKYCPDLEELIVNSLLGSKIDKAVSALSQNCRQLHTLHIESEYLADSIVQLLCDNCSRLDHIGLICSDSLTDASLIAIANSHANLKIIHLCSDDFTDDGLIQLVDKCRELRSVSLCSDDITNRGLAALWTANPNLMELNISESDCSSDDDVIQLVQCCPLLQKLNISFCDRITDAAVIAVAEHCPQLISLDISECSDVSDASLVALGQHSHELKSINISSLQNISDVGIAALAGGYPLLQDFCAGSTNITDAGMISLARGCRDVSKIDISRGKSIGIVSLSVIAEECPLISQLLISGCIVDNACMYIIAQHCCNLTVLDIRHTKVTDAAAVISVIKSCRVLREIECCFNEKKDRDAIFKYSPRIHVRM